MAREVKEVAVEVKAALKEHAERDAHAVMEAEQAAWVADETSAEEGWQRQDAQAKAEAAALDRLLSNRYWGKETALTSFTDRQVETVAFRARVAVAT